MILQNGTALSQVEQEIASLSTMPNPESSFVACAYQTLGEAF